MSTKKVVTVTLNPALDLTGHLNTINIDSVNLVEQGCLRAAGKGINVAQVLSDLGADVTATGFLGRNNQALFCELFSQLKVQDRFIRVDGTTRINVKLVEASGATSDINFPSFQVSPSEIEQFENTLFELAEDHDYFVIAGSLPTGITPVKLASWILKLHNMGKKVVFDSSRSALKAGLNAHPWLIKPNHEELSEFMEEQLITPKQCKDAAEKLAKTGIQNIVVSMGAAGVMWLHDGKWLSAQPPKMQVVSTVGAGDTLVAGLCWGHMQNMNKLQLLTFATALSALAVSQVGVGIKSLSELKAIQEKITLNK